MFENSLLRFLGQFETQNPCKWLAQKIKTCKTSKLEAVIHRIRTLDLKNMCNGFFKLQKPTFRVSDRFEIPKTSDSAAAMSPAKISILIGLKSPSLYSDSSNFKMLRDAFGRWWHTARSSSCYRRHHLTRCSSFDSANCKLHKHTRGAYRRHSKHSEISTHKL